MEHTELRRETGQRGVREVAASTIMAAHRRDHDHGVDRPMDQPGRPGVDRRCHPHAVEVVHLGDRAFMICHDCRYDSGLLPERQAGRLAQQHRQLTREPHVA